MKVKLIALRKDRRFTQQDLATLLKISPTHYQRKERGEVKIFDDEWDKIANLLDVSVDEVREDDTLGTENHYFDSVSGNNNYVGSNNNYCNVPEFLLENQKDYINSLKEKIATQEEIIAAQEAEIQHLKTSF